MRGLQETVHQEAMKFLVDAAKADGVVIHEAELALASQQDLLVAGALVAGLEELDFRHMFERGPVLTDTPIMYWYLTGEVLESKECPLSEGFYTVVADQRQGTVALKDGKGKTVARGDLKVEIEPPDPPKAMAKLIGITTFDVNRKKKHVKICGNINVEVGPVSVHAHGCVEVNWK